jgi:hypothetical protein
MTKKLLMLLLSAYLLSSCVTMNLPIDGYKPVTNKSDDVNTFNRKEYVLKENVTAKANSYVLWVTFIPCGNFAKESTLTRRSYRRAVAEARKANPNETIDGLLNPQYTTSRVTVPLILLTYSYKKVVCTGRAFRLKTDEELNETQK